jgi:hypothetical protein
VLGRPQGGVSATADQKSGRIDRGMYALGAFVLVSGAAALLVFWAWSILIGGVAGLVVVAIGWGFGKEMLGDAGIPLAAKAMTLIGTIMAGIAAGGTIVVGWLID